MDVVTNPGANGRLVAFVLRASKCFDDSCILRRCQLDVLFVALDQRHAPSHQLDCHRFVGHGQSAAVRERQCLS